jgi:putative flippase GtrA
VSDDIRPVPAAEGAGAFRTLFRNRMVRYLIAGGLSFIVDFGMLAVLHEVLHWPTWIATAVAFIISFAFTYTIQRVFAFGGTSPHGTTLVKYTVLVIFNLVATTLIVSWIGQSSITWAGGKVIATVATTVWNYFVYKYWVFAERPRRASSRRN